MATLARISAMVAHYKMTVKAEELMHPFIFAEREEWDVANNTPGGLMRRARHLCPKDFQMFLNGVSPD